MLRYWPRVFKRSQNVGQCCWNLYRKKTDLGSTFTQKPLRNRAISAHEKGEHSKPSIQCARTSATMLGEPRNERNMLRHALPITRTKEILVDIDVALAGSIVWLATLCRNDRNILRPTMLDDVVPTCCVCFRGALTMSSIIILFFLTAHLCSLYQEWQECGTPL